MTSQQTTVDWYCFWLKGEEDRDPAKAQQYARWRELRKLQRGKRGKKEAKLTRSVEARFPVSAKGCPHCAAMGSDVYECRPPFLPSRGKEKYLSSILTMPAGRG